MTVLSRFSLEGKVAVVTGASSGLGVAFARAMAEAGASPGSTVVIGDTAFDMGMARAAGARGIGAGWGYHSAGELLAAGACGVAGEPLDVLGLLAEEPLDG